MTLKRLMDLRGRRALVTGATGHIGAVICDTLAELGAEIVLVDLPGSDLKKIQKKIEQKWKIKTHVLFCDLEFEAHRNQLNKEIKSDSRGLNILINNAAFVGTSKLLGWTVPFEMQSLATWRRAFEVNLTTAFHLSQGLAPCLRRSDGANILNITSIYGHEWPDWSVYKGTKIGNPAAYSVSKGGLIQLTRWLAASLEPKVRVNAIAPGGLFRNQPKNFVSRYSNNTLLKRMGNESDLIGAISFLATDLSKYVTGQNLFIDGGRNF